MESPRKKVSNGVTLVLIVIIAIIALGIKKCKEHHQVIREQSESASANDWRHHKIIYTSHARCRMECRDISEDEVEYILDHGTLNEGKSQEEGDDIDGHCPSYALEGNTNDGQHVRIIFGACDEITKVITAIDLDNEHECNCR